MLEGSRFKSDISSRIEAVDNSGGLEVKPSADAHQLSPASRNRKPISVSFAPWNTGVLASNPRMRAAHPR